MIDLPKMTVERRDEYKNCNIFPTEVTLEDFQRQFCSRCLRPECTRSQHGKSKFDQRVATWESRLFTDVPRMSMSDPRFEQFQAKRFLEIRPSGGRIPEVQGWVDPRDLDQPKAEATPEVPEPQVEEVTQKPPIQEPPTPPANTRNTPNRRGQMVGGKKVDVRPTKPVSDPWEPKKAPEEKIVKPGTKIRLSGS